MSGFEISTSEARRVFDHIKNAKDSLGMTHGAWESGSFDPNAPDQAYRMHQALVSLTVAIELLDTRVQALTSIHIDDGLITIDEEI